MANKKILDGLFQTNIFDPLEYTGIDELTS